MIKQFDHDECNRVSKQAMLALREVAERHGLNVERGRGKYTSDTFSFRLTFVVGQYENRSAADWSRYCHRWLGWVRWPQRLEPGTCWTNSP